MGNVEAENISRYLRTKDIQLPVKNKWLLDCINWYKSHSELRNIYNSLEDYVCIQWLLSDLRDVQHCCLPTNSKDGTIQLTSKYCVQVNWARDISQPCYTQLQTMRNVNIADSNENVTAEETKKQTWEPSPKRVLMMEITDGNTTLKAMEYAPIPKLTEPFIPGFKVVLIGPIECRKGVLLLKNNNISLLGGEVDYMSDLYSKENILSRCLNIAPLPNDGSGRHTNAPVTTPSTPVGNIRPQQLFNDLNQLPDSTSFIESNPFQDNRNSIMEVDDDDEMLCQLPDTMFNDDYNCDVQPNRLSPVLDGNSPDEEVHSFIQEDTPENIQFLPSTAKNTDKLTSFSSVDDTRPEKGSVLASNSKQRQPGMSLASRSTNSSDSQPGMSLASRSANSSNSQPGMSLASRSANRSNKSLYEKPNVSLNDVPVEQRPARNDKDDSLMSNIDDETGNRSIYPEFKRVKVKVTSITKLKIRNGEWACCASVLIEDKNEYVTFCNKVLDKLFGTSAAEVEVLRSEMAKNQSLKEKINDILKAGQTKLKLLNCWMIVEYTSDDCIPNIVSIHEEL